MQLNEQRVSMSESKPGNRGGENVGKGPDVKEGPEAREGLEFKNRIIKALEIAAKFGQEGRVDHKMWVMDQMIRELTACPTVKKSAIGANGKPYTFDALGESDDYKKFVRKARRNSLNVTGEWEVGKAP